MNVFRCREDCGSDDSTKELYRVRWEQQRTAKERGSSCPHRPGAPKEAETLHGEGLCLRGLLLGDDPSKARLGPGKPVGL